MSNTTDIIESSSIADLLNDTNITYCIAYRLISCYISNGFANLAYILSLIGFLSQIIHLFIYRTRYIAGISYTWILIRLLAVSFLVARNAFKWTAIFPFVAFILTVIVLVQIIAFSKSIRQESKRNLIVITLSIWILTMIFIVFFEKEKKLLNNIGYVLLPISFLPQILLNSLLQTAKALSRFSILFLIASDGLLLIFLPMPHDQIVTYISIYYSFSFLVFIYVQRIIFNDEYIYIISRSQHIFVTPNVDVFAGINFNRFETIGRDAQILTAEDFDILNGLNQVYQPVTIDESSIPKKQQSLMKRFIWFIHHVLLCSMTLAVTIIFVKMVASPWIILILISISAIYIFFFLLRAPLIPLIEIL